MLNKKAASFGTIVAVFGSILIALGVIWLVAQNWHQLNSTIKIIILLSATCGAYIASHFLKLKKYHGLGNALIVLGALLYTASIFLIAQIFNTSTTLQGIAWLFFLCWIGVFLTSYIFTSPFSIIIALIEFIIWMIIQFLAIFESNHSEPYLGILALSFLISGVLFYGLYLIHSAKKHEFTNVYRWWTIFYLLFFVYLITFQSSLPALWSNASYLALLMIFLIVLLFVAVIILIIGIIKALEQKAVAKKELYWFTTIIFLLAVLIGSTGFVADSMGVCFEKSCYDIRTKDLCNKAPEDMKCVWKDNNCMIKNCYIYNDQNSCENSSVKCEWGPSPEELKNIKDSTAKPIGGCREITCYDHKDKSSCIRLNCTWIDGVCNEKACYNFRDEQSCIGSKELDCKWIRNFCDVKSPCGEFNNNYDACSTQDKCKWQATYVGYYGQKNKVPLSLWAVWIFANLIFLLLILIIIGYGTWKKNTALINLGIIFFSLDVITRYIGFIMDFWGYTSLSLFFIIGGIILIFGGLFIEKWRRKLIQKTK